MNAGVAANVLSDNSDATADATQTADIDQSNNAGNQNDPPPGTDQGGTS